MRKSDATFGVDLTRVQDNPTVSVTDLLFTLDGRHLDYLLYSFQKYLLK